MSFERHLFEALARGFRRKQAQQAEKVKVVRDEKVLDDGNRVAFEIVSPESIMAQRAADRLGRLAAEFEDEARLTGDQPHGRQ